MDALNLLIENTDNKLNKLIVHPLFHKMLAEIKKVNITLSEPGKNNPFDFSKITFPANGVLKVVETLQSYNLNAINGQRKSQIYNFTGYDESKLDYMSLEGCASFTAHSLVLNQEHNYLPVNLLTFYFYTRSELLIQSHPVLTYTEDVTSQANKDYVQDRFQFLKEWSIKESISFIDGPLIGGNMSGYTIQLVQHLQKQGIIPIFIVKNSDSNLVTDNIPELKNKYNSDIHWTYHFLKEGQRSNFFIYTDNHSKEKSKVFCYLKAFGLSPQRVEMHYSTFQKHSEIINELMDIIYYLFLVHGDKKNPQIRPIAIAEKFARSILNMSDTYNLIKSSGLIPTMNQERFGGK